LETLTINLSIGIWTHICGVRLVVCLWIWELCKWENIEEQKITCCKIYSRLRA